MVKLPPMVREEVVAKLSNAGKAAAAEGSESDSSESKYSGSMSDDEEESMDSAAASKDERILTGGEAMLHNMPNEDDTTLAKRKAVQSVVQDWSLSVLKTNKKIQDIMAGKVVLPRVVAAKEPASTASCVDPTKKKETLRAQKARNIADATGATASTEPILGRGCSLVSLMMLTRWIPRARKELIATSMILGQMRALEQMPQGRTRPTTVPTHRPPAERNTT